MNQQDQVYKKTGVDEALQDERNKTDRTCTRMEKDANTAFREAWNKAWNYIKTREKWNECKWIRSTEDDEKDLD